MPIKDELEKLCFKAQFFFNFTRIKSHKTLQRPDIKEPLTFRKIVQIQFAIYFFHGNKKVFLSFRLHQI